MLDRSSLETIGSFGDGGRYPGRFYGVGSVAVALLSRLGYQVAASTGRQETADYLRSLGASEILPREELGGKPRPLARERWAGAIDVALRKF